MPSITLEQLQYLLTAFTIFCRKLRVSGVVSPALPILKWSLTVIAVVFPISLHLALIYNAFYLLLYICIVCTIFKDRYVFHIRSIAILKTNFSFYSLFLAHLIKILDHFLSFGCLSVISSHFDSFFTFWLLLQN